jgi:hypothetical protein
VLLRGCPSWHLPPQPPDMLNLGPPRCLELRGALGLELVEVGRALHQECLCSALAPHQARQRARVGPWAFCGQIAPLSASQRPSRACPIQALRGRQTLALTGTGYRLPATLGAVGRPIPVRTAPI